jgi:hypothetical protein
MMATYQLPYTVLLLVEVFVLARSYQVMNNEKRNITDDEIGNACVISGLAFKHCFGPPDKTKR